MHTPIGGSGLGTRSASGGPRLFLVLVGLSSLQVHSIGQTIPARVVRPLLGDPRITQPARVERNRDRSIELYRKHCIECHEADGRGEESREIMRRIPDFTKHEWHTARKDDHMIGIIREGKGSMPAMKDKLGPTDVVLLVALVRGFQGGTQVIPDESESEEESPKPTETQRSTERTAPNAGPAGAVPHPAIGAAQPRSDAGRGVFQRFCVRCHGADGRGDRMRATTPSIPDFTSPDWGPRRSDAELMTSILEGKGTVMPAFEDKLGEAQAREVLIYVRSFVSAKAPSTTKPSSDFRRRFNELRDEMERLDRQYRALSSQ